MRKKYLVSILVICALVSMPVVTHAATWQSIVNLFANWQKQIVMIFRREQKATTTKPVACTMEAKQCPDGSYVGRSGPKCEFKACPADNFSQVGNIVFKNNNWYLIYDKPGAPAMEMKISFKTDPGFSSGAFKNGDRVKVAGILTDNGLYLDKIGKINDPDITCPRLAPAGPNFCSNGKIVGHQIDSNGCPLPPKCELSNTPLASRQTYRNEKYGFELKLPADWVGYRVKEQGYKSVNGTEIRYLNFFLPTKVKWSEENGEDGFGSVFMIEVYTVTEWNKMRQQCGSPNGATWLIGCDTDDGALLENDKIVLSTIWPNSGPDVNGDKDWGNLKKEVNFDYLKNNISFTK